MARPSLPLGAHGKIARTQLPDGRWRASCRIRDMDGVTRKVYRETPAGQRDRTGAVAERYLLEALLERGLPQDGEISAATKVEVLWTEYRKQLVDGDRSPATMEDYDRLAARICAGIGQQSIREASTQQLDRFLREMADRHGVPTARKTRGILSGMFKIAVRYGALTTNPVREVSDLASRRTARKRSKSMDAAALAQLLHDVRHSTAPCPVVLSDWQKKKGLRTTSKPGQIPTVAQYCDGADLADVITMFAATGCRISELLGIRWKDLDLEARSVTISGKVIRVRRAGIIRESTTKSAAGMRTLPLPGFAVEMLEARERRADMVFPSAVDTYRDPDTVSRQWRQVRAALGLEWVTTHTFRKTVATLIDEEGLSARGAADHLGHAQVSMTTDVYFGRGRTHSVVADALDAVVGGSNRYVSGTSEHPQTKKDPR
ncbi:integrase [Rhodococcus sp. p52]|uniref:site-specific integrase n=2 Tax=Bacteria TaxID=2 RepID=UPI000826D9D2|nr:tyrosine-type recombinase/integrase [Rhodococcus sp. p52]AOD23845.1 integrase [Rhodococcus sp. p52]